MLETAYRDGPGKCLEWSPSEGQTVRTPALIVPETKRFGRLDSDLVLTANPTGQAIELVSDGTWFHPRGATGPLVVSAPEPSPTTEVQVLLVGDVAVWHDAGGWMSNPARGVPALIEAKTQAAGRALWAPALGTPADYAVYAYAGIDLFDASPLLMAAQRRTALTPDGPLAAEAFSQLYGAEATVDELARFNVEQATLELARVRLAIQEGNLRALAERRCYTSPEAVALLRLLDKEHHSLEAETPGHDERVVACMSHEALWMPAVERFRRRLREEYTPPASSDILVLLPCSAKKPYRISNSHRFFARALDYSGVRHRVHEVMITSPLGIVPRELESTYPANKYDVPVTGAWTEDEKKVIREQVAALLAKTEYKHVIAHIPEGTWNVLQDVLPDNAVHTGLSRSVQAKRDCDNLRDTLAALKDKQLPASRQAYNVQKLEAVQGIASYQFGAAAGAALVAKGHAHGRVPYVKLSGPQEQRGMTSQDRGMLSLTIGGAIIVAPHNVKTVHIGDFEIKKTGSLFAVGVTNATPDVRAGDDVVIMQAGQVRGCGIAKMSATEMVHRSRGVAVSIRHLVKTTEVTA